MTLDLSTPFNTCLLLDLGNTRLKVGLWHADQPDIEPLAAIAHADPNLLRQQLQTTLQQLSEQTRHALKVALGVSVASQARMDLIEEVLKNTLGTTQTHWLWPQEAALGVTNGYPEPSQLGADRWMSVLGLRHHFGALNRSLILANFGTATTIDTLSQESVFLGGLILPGVTMMHDALLHGTARLPLAKGQITPYPTDTHSAITSGIAAAQIGAIVRQYELSQKRDQQAPILCVSGGAWQIVATEWQRQQPDITVTELPHVVLMGLSFFAQAQYDQPAY